MPKNKTVYILGAGISKADGLPLQSEILSHIFSLNPENQKIDTSFMQLNVNKSEEKVLLYFDEFERQRRELADFIIDNFASQRMKAEYNAIMRPVNHDEHVFQFKDNILRRAYEIISNGINVTLEDIFTIFDKAILGHEYFRIYSTQEIEEKKDSLRKCIIFLLSYQCSLIEKKDNYSTKLFAKMLFDKRMSVSYKNDIVSVITTNWDTLLEKELFRLCKEVNLANKRTKIYLDLCFYDYPYYNTLDRIVSTHVKAKGHRNIKFLKLHGSINWLICPCCGRVFVDYEENIALNELSLYCPCKKCVSSQESSQSPRMRSILITPTFLKDISDLHIKNVWHNALIDIMEAQKIIFIGYSFPDADFEMRYILKKAVQPDTNIEVVLHDVDNPIFYKTMLNKHNATEKEIDSVIDMLKLPEKRYKAFFGNDFVKLHYCGIEEYLHKEIDI
jgi:NAD-dependent SIR2 family protein deacetylase